MTMMYGLTATVALAAAPALVRVTLVTVSALTRPTTLKSSDGLVVSNATVSP